MRIAYLCKRRYMGKDVVIDRYARLYEIPKQLALLGHHVEAWCFAYADDPPLETEDDGAPGTLRWHVSSWGHSVLPGLVTYPHRMLNNLRAFRPDVVVAASDIPHVALGAWLAGKLGRPFVADLYDNFEGFGQARIPGMVRALRAAVRTADLVYTTSEPLREFVNEEYCAKGEVIAMPSTVDKSVFHSRDRRQSRLELGLPDDVRLIGSAGGLNRGKGIETLVEAWSLLSSRRTDVHLVLAGPREARMHLPTGERVHYLGALPHDRVATVFAALDVGVICINDTAFGRYCFPQKAYEMLACGLAVVAADVGAMGRLFDQHRSSCLYPAGDAGMLCERIEAQLRSPVIVETSIDDWATLVARMERRMVNLI